MLNNNNSIACVYLHILCTCFYITTRVTTSMDSLYTQVFIINREAPNQAMRCFPKVLSLRSLWTWRCLGVDFRVQLPPNKSWHTAFHQGRFKMSKQPQPWDAYCTLPRRGRILFALLTSRASSFWSRELAGCFTSHAILRRLLQWLLRPRTDCLLLSPPAPTTFFDHCFVHQDSPSRTHQATTARFLSPY